jgi:DNA-directed RNA polymerase specialized sigma subunit
LLRRRGVVIRQRRSLSQDQVVEAARYESGLYLRQVAERFGVSTEQVRQALRRHGLTMREDRGGRRRIT